jgi:N-acetylmuramoyl-L-alanine amidase
VLDNLTDIEILELTLHGEARGEPVQGQIAVGCDIRNRLHDNPTKYKSYHDVCLEKEQFSCWNFNDSNYPILLQMGVDLINNVPNTIDRQIVWVAQGIMSYSIRDNTHNTTHYMTTSLFNSPKRPVWARNAKVITVIGEQTFFNV